MDDSLVSLLSLSSSSSPRQSGLDDTIGSLDGFDLSTSLNSISLSDTDTEEPLGSDSEDVPVVEASLRAPLYEGSELTAWDCYLHIMRYALRHSITKTALSDLLGLVGLLLPGATSTSLYRFKKAFLELYEDISFTSHYCCSYCHSPYVARDSDCCNGCDAGSVEFMTISVEAQLKRKFQGKSYSSCLMFKNSICTFRS